MRPIAAAGQSAVVKSMKPFFPLLVYAAVAALVATVYLSAFRQIESLILQEKFNYLGATAEDKAGQIAAWRDTQKRTGESLSNNSILAAGFEQWLREGTPPDGRQRMLRQKLEELQHVNGYKTLALLDRQGAVRLSISGMAALDAEDTLLARQAMERREAVFSDLHRDDNKNIDIDLVAPLLVSGRVVGAALLQIDPSSFLYPLTQAWPIPSASGETLLVRQDGNDALFLNELRHQKNSALTLRIPLTTPKLPSALAFKGVLRTADAIDYRGVAVVAEMRRVPGTSWIVISKIDRDELFNPVAQLEKWSAGIGMLYVAIGGLLVLALLHGQKVQNRFLQAQRDAAVERAMLVKHFELLTKYANDIIVVADEAGAIVEANERAETAYGYTREELLGMRVPDLRDPDEDPAVFAGQLQRLREAGELRYETRSRRKDGTVFPVEVSARVITVEGVKFMQGIIRDISERKRAEAVLRKSEGLLNESQQMAHIGSWELDLVNNILYWTEENYRIFEIDRELFGASYEAFLNTIHPDDRALVDEAYTGSVKNRTPYTIVHRLLFPDGRIKYVREWCETFYDAAGQPLRSVGTTQDITEQQFASEAQRKAAAEIEDLYNQAPCGYHSLDSSGVIVQINDTELQWLGYAREEAIGMNFADMLTPASLEVFRSNYPGFKQRGFVHDLEYELVRKDGTTFYVSLNATAVFNAAGQYAMSRSTLFDISARKRADEELRLHGAILSQMEEGVALVRADAATVVYVNPKLEKMFGYPPGEMIGMHVSRLNAPVAKSPEEMAREIIAALQDRGKWDGEIVNQRKDGTPFWCHASVTTFEHHSYGTVWVSTHEDITERRQVEKKLEESEERFRTMANNAPIMIWMADAQGRTDYRGSDFFNQRWHDFTGLPRERAQGRDWLDIVHPDDGERCLEAYATAFRNMRPFKQEYRLRRHDGVFRWVQDSGVPRFTEEGRFLGLIGTCLDVTDHKLFEEIREEMEHVGRLNIAGEMASSLAHELSQPLSAANNYLDASLRRMEESNWDKGNLQRSVRLAYAQTERAGAIVSHLKNLVRKQKQERSMLDVNALIRDTVGFMDYELHQHFIRFALELSALPPVLANRVGVEQVLINLVKNAIDSMQSTPRRELRIATRVIASGAVLVSVRDTGKGIAADELDKIFNLFQTSKKEGLGLGLPICRSLVESYGGQIWAEQNGDGGAEFNFTLPIGGGL
ncbi:MAG: PAS domain S-box protein [Nitrosomonadales bacterium]|nr:PAS domain S-box protein [Nitrosomonadales bacterium]